MKTLLLSFILLTSLPSFADGTFLTRALSPNARGENLPPDLHFETHQVHIVNPVWFSSIFGTRTCDTLLTPSDLAGHLEIKADGASAVSVTLNARAYKMLEHARAEYVPVHYQGGHPVHPYFLIKLPGWVTLHAIIHRSGETKTLVLSLIQGRGANAHLSPILEATGA